MQANQNKEVNPGHEKNDGDGSVGPSLLLPSLWRHGHVAHQPSNSATPSPSSVPDYMTRMLFESHLSVSKPNLFFTTHSLQKEYERKHVK